MTLTLGKSFDRNYNLYIPFINGFYTIKIFFNKKSSFLLFDIDSSFPNGDPEKSVKINMFKSLEQSKFCEVFVKLHNYRNKNLNIRNQFDSINPEYSNDIRYLFNETIILSKTNDNDKSYFNKLTLYGFTLDLCKDNYIFMISERQHIITRLSKKVVTTTGIQIATGDSIELLDEFHDEKIKYRKLNNDEVIPDNDSIIDFYNVEKEEIYGTKNVKKGKDISQ